MKQELVKLPYSYDSLEPFIDKQTMEIHHLKHHQAYVNNFNALMDKNPDLQDKPLEMILSDMTCVPDEDKQALINQGGGVYNHNIFWHSMTPNSTKKPHGKIAEEIEKTFQSFENFKDLFSITALGKFGSGWVWLVEDVPNNVLKIVATSNQDTVLSMGLTPLLNLDVWEHAYYLKYQNRRNEYIENWWNVVDWSNVENLYKGLTHI